MSLRVRSRPWFGERRMAGAEDREQLAASARRVAQTDQVEEFLGRFLYWRPGVPPSSEALV